MQKQTSKKKSLKANLAKWILVTALALGSLLPLAVSADTTPTPAPTPVSTPKPPIRDLPSEMLVSWNS